MHAHSDSIFSKGEVSPSRALCCALPPLRGHPATPRLQHERRRRNTLETLFDICYTMVTIYKIIFKDIVWRIRLCLLQKKYGSA